MYRKRLQRIRKRREIKVYQIAEVLEIERSAYGHFEKEDSIMPLKHLVAVCDYFNVSLDYVFEFTNKENYNDSIKGLDLEITSKRLKEFRVNKKISQKALAIRTDNKRTNISGYETGDCLISTSFLYTICKIYGLSADYIVGKVNVKPRTKVLVGV